LTGSGSKAAESRRALRVHLAGDSEIERAKARAVLSKIADPIMEVSEGALSQEIGGESDLVMVLFNQQEAAPLGYLQGRTERTPRPAMIALLHERSPALMRRALHAGRMTCCFCHSRRPMRFRPLMKLSGPQDQSPRGDGGVIYSMVSLSGGAGLTTLCANLALALNYTLGKGAAVVDLDLQNGGLSLALQVEPEHSIVALPEFLRTLDSIKLESTLTRHPSGIYLLAAPRRIEDADRISDVMVDAVLNLMRQLFDFIVVDCGQRADENAVAAWERSDEVLYVIDQSLAAARRMRRFADLFARLGLPGVETHYVLNKWDPQSAITESHLCETIGEQFYSKIPRDDKLIEKAQLRRQDVWQTGPASAYVKAVESLARRLTTRREAAPAPAPGLFARLFKASETRAGA
jgi:Flp pilus assembly CpaE family ATPase